MNAANHNIYNGIISLRWTMQICFSQFQMKAVQQVVQQFGNSHTFIRSTSSSAVRQITCAVIITLNEVKCPLLWKIWIKNFSQRILERVFVGSIVNIRNKCLFSGFMGMNWSPEQTNRPWTASRFIKFVCPARSSYDLFVLRSLNSIPRTQKKTLIP